MKQGDLFQTTPLTQAVAALRQDLIGEDGPRISTMRNYCFAILQYNPELEFELRAEVQRLSSDLMAHGWKILSIDLQKLLLDRARSLGPEWTERLIQRERDIAKHHLTRGLNVLKGKLTPLIEGPEGIAADCSRLITEHIEAHADSADHLLVLIGRAGALYPVYRSSALLKHLDGRTRNVPVVLLYPGERRGATGLSFMGHLPPDNDYRPRIYP